MPSGTTIDGANNRQDVGSVYATSLSATSYTGKVDFGQGVDYKIYMGVAPLSMIAPTNGTRLSDGTVQFLTGLTTINSFRYCLQDSSVSPGHSGYPLEIHHMTGYKTTGGVTVFLSVRGPGNTDWSGATPAQVGSGVSLHWMAMGE